MSGTKFLFISKEEQVYKIPTPNVTYKAIPELANQDVLEVVLHYETLNRKPHKLVFVQFQRLALDVNGQYVLTLEEIRKQTRNFMEFGLHTPETLSEEGGPLPIPSAVTIPTQSEKECLKKYIKEHLPQLVNTGFHVLEREIQSRIQTNFNNKKLIIDAMKIRKATK